MLVAKPAEEWFVPFTFAGIAINFTTFFLVLKFSTILPASFDVLCQVHEIVTLLLVNTLAAPPKPQNILVS